jgi:hypothetical protein
MTGETVPPTNGYWPDAARNLLASIPTTPPVPMCSAPTAADVSRAMQLVEEHGWFHLLAPSNEQQ